MLPKALNLISLNIFNKIKGGGQKSHYPDSTGNNVDKDKI